MGASPQGASLQGASPQGEAQPQGEARFLAQRKVDSGWEPVPFWSLYESLAELQTDLGTFARRAYPYTHFRVVEVMVVRVAVDMPPLRQFPP